MPYNFFGPTFEAKIRTPANQELFLSPRRRIDKKGVPIATQLEVKTGLGQNVEISLTLKPHSREMGFALLGDSGFDPEGGPELSQFIRIGHHLVVRWGYTGEVDQQSEWWAGLMTKPDVSIGEEVEITLRAQGFQWWAYREMGNKQWGGVEEGPPQPMSAFDIIEEIAKKHGWEIVNPEAFPVEFDEQRIDYVQSNVNDWGYLKYLCGQNGIYVTMRKGTELNFHVIKEDGKFNPVAKFVYGAKSYGDKNIFPIVGSIETPTDLLFIPHRGDIKTSILNLLTKKPVEEKASPSETKDKVTQGDGNVGNVRGDAPKKDSETGQHFSEEALKKDSASKFFSQPAREAKLKATLEGYYKTSAERAGLPIEFDTVGVPTLEPGLIVSVEVGATFFSGNFKIKELTHTVGEGGYDMHVSCICSGMPDKLMSEAFSGPTSAGAETQKEVSSGGGVTKKPKKV